MPGNEEERQDNVKASKDLWAQVMLQAIQDIVKPKGNPGEKRLHRESALYWLNDVENGKINSFIGICNLLEMNPDKARIKILELKNKRGFDVVF